MAQDQKDFFVRVPPDSTGKRVRNRADIVLPFDSGTRSFIVGEIITGATSGLSGEVYEVEGSSATGTVYLRLTGSSVEAATSGESLRDVNASTIALAASVGTTFYTQLTHIAGGTELGNLVNVDHRGQLSVRAGEHPLDIDAFGRLRVSEPVILAEYTFHYDDTNRIETTLTGSATATHDPDIAGIVMATGTGSGDKVARRTNRYHLYEAGISKLVEMTVIIGDTGKTNVRRRWGYFDDDDGLFFELDGTTLNVVQRSSTSGTAVDTPVAQSSWNRDRLDGTKDKFNPSGFSLDVSLNNIYWIDFQWLGAGSVRFGLILDGERIVCHEFKNANGLLVPYMKTATLPVSWEQDNTGVPGSGSEMRTICTAVINEGAFDPAHNHHSYSRPSLVTASATGGSSIPILSVRAACTFNAIENRAWAIPESVHVLTTAASAPTVLAIEIVENAALDGATFATGVTNSMLEIDIAATNSSAGNVMYSTLLNPVGGFATKELDLTPLFRLAGELIHRRATIGASTDIYTVQIRRITGSADATAAINWIEIL